MIILGLVLLVVAVIFGADLLFKNNHHIANPAVFGQHLGFHNEATLLIVAAITGAVIVLAIALILSGIRHKGAKAVSHHQERKDAKRTGGERDDLVADNEHLRAELAQRRAADRPVEAAQTPGASTASDR